MGLFRCSLLHLDCSTFLYSIKVNGWMDWWIDGVILILSKLSYEFMMLCFMCHVVVGGRWSIDFSLAAFGFLFLRFCYILWCLLPFSFSSFLLFLWSGGWTCQVFTQNSMVWEVRRIFSCDLQFTASSGRGVGYDGILTLPYQILHARNSFKVLFLVLYPYKSSDNCNCNNKNIIPFTILYMHMHIYYIYQQW